MQIKKLAGRTEPAAGARPESKDEGQWQATALSSPSRCGARYPAAT